MPSSILVALRVAATPQRFDRIERDLDPTRCQHEVVADDHAPVADIRLRASSRR